MKQLTMNKLLTPIFIFFSIFAYAQDFSITNFDINIEINSDGSLLVEETIDVYFTKRKRGIYREIENTYKINNATLYLDINNIDIKDHEYKVDKSKNKVSIRIGSPDAYLTGIQQYKISYKIKNGIIPYPEHQEFHYDLTGIEWEAPIDKVNFKIKLPKSITFGPNDLKVTGGRQNESLDLAEIKQIDSRTIVGSSLYPLKKYNGITAAIKLPQRYLEVASNDVSFFKQEKEKKENNDQPWFVVLPLALLGLFISFWRKMRKTDFNPEDQGIQIYPPEGLTSAHVGGFVDQSSNDRDIVSLLPYWGGEGFIEMKQIGDEVYLYKMKNLPPDFPEYEHIIFDRLFQDSEVSKLSDLKTKFHTTLRKAQSLLTEEIEVQEYYNQEYVNFFRGPKFIIFPLTMLAIGLFCLIYFQFIALGIGFILAALGGFILRFFKLPLTTKGAKLKSEIDAFKDFLKNPDESRLAEVVNDDPKYFDKMFPFAVALGIEKSFLKSLEPHMSTAPYWYYSDVQNNSFTNFSSNFQPEVIQSAFNSAPHTASGSSSGGGFSSGSGVGGGGGGSW